MDSLPEYQIVTFCHVPENYPIDCDVECIFKRHSTCVSSKNDWVGLYKVGWSSSKEHVVYKWAPVGVENGLEIKVLFEAQQMPKNDGEFYQFCYVTHSGQVRGISSPFQFKPPQVDDFIEVEDIDDDIMIVKSRSSALQDELHKVMQDRDSLNKKCRALEMQKAQQTQTIQDLNQDLADEQQHVVELRQQLDEKCEELKQLHVEAKDMQILHEGLREKIRAIREEKLGLTRQLEDRETYVKSLQEKIKALVNEKDALTGRARILEEERDLFKTNYSSSESEIQKYMKNMDYVEREKAAAIAAVNERSEKLREVEEQYRVTSQKLGAAQAQCTQLKDEVAALKEHIHCSEEKIQALEDCKRSLGADIDALVQTNSKLSIDVEKAKSESYSHKLQYDKLKEEHDLKISSVTAEIEFFHEKLEERTKLCETQAAEIQLLQTSLEQITMERNKVQETDGSLVALKAAMESLKNRLQKSETAKERLEKEVAELVKYKTSQETLESEHQQERRDYQERLKMGEQSYMEQYVERRRLEKELKKIQRNQPAAERRGSETSAASSFQLSREEMEQQLQEMSLELTKRSEMIEKYQKLYEEQKKRTDDLELQIKNDLRKQTQHAGAANVTVTIPKKVYDDEVRQQFDPLHKVSQPPTPQPSAPVVPGEVKLEQGVLMSVNSLANTCCQKLNSSGHMVPSHVLSNIPSTEGSLGSVNLARSAGSVAQGSMASVAQGSLGSFSGWESLPQPQVPENCCPFCFSIFPTNESLQIHVHAHDQPGKSVCPICDRTFSEKDVQGLQQHVIEHLERSN